MDEAAAEGDPVTTAVAADARDPRPLYVLQLEAVLRRLVELSDGGVDTYPVKDIVEEARRLLKMPDE